MATLLLQKSMKDNSKNSQNKEIKLMENNDFNINITDNFYNSLNFPVGTFDLISKTQNIIEEIDTNKSSTVKENEYNQDITSVESTPKIVIGNENSNSTLKNISTMNPNLQLFESPKRITKSITEDPKISKPKSNHTDNVEIPINSPFKYKINNKRKISLDNVENGNSCSTVNIVFDKDNIQNNDICENNSDFGQNCISHKNVNTTHNQNSLPNDNNVSNHNIIGDDHFSDSSIDLSKSKSSDEQNIILSDKNSLNLKNNDYIDSDCINTNVIQYEINLPDTQFKRSATKSLQKSKKETPLTPKFTSISKLRQKTKIELKTSDIISSFKNLEREVLDKYYNSNSIIINNKVNNKLNKTTDKDNDNKTTKKVSNKVLEKDNNNIIVKDNKKISDKDIIKVTDSGNNLENDKNIENLNKKDEFQIKTRVLDLELVNRDEIITNSEKFSTPRQLPLLTTPNKTTSDRSEITKKRKLSDETPTKSEKKIKQRRELDYFCDPYLITSPLNHRAQKNPIIVAYTKMNDLLIRHGQSVLYFMENLFHKCLSYDTLGLSLSLVDSVSTTSLNFPINYLTVKDLLKSGNINFNSLELKDFIRLVGTLYLFI